MTDRSSTEGRARRQRRALPALKAFSSPRRHLPRPRLSERGAVTAETAVVLPLLAAMTLGLVWLVGLTVTQVRVVDAARETARAVARDEPLGAATQLGRRVAPDGSVITVEDEPGSVRVRVVAEVRGPGGLFSFLPGLEVDGEAVAAREAR